MIVIYIVLSNFINNVSQTKLKWLLITANLIYAIEDFKILFKLSIYDDNSTKKGNHKEYCFKENEQEFANILLQYDILNTLTSPFSRLLEENKLSEKGSRA